jgi:retinol dehydrogenase-14
MTTPDMQGRVCLITGATAGIGKATAHGLAAAGASLILVSRDRARGEATRDEIRAKSGNAQVEVLFADLASQASIRTLADEVLARYPKLHVLLNNAGGVFSPREETVDGLERTFAVNHMAYFLLSKLLLERLRESAPARIINVSSEAQSMGKIDFDDLQGQRKYDVLKAYGQSKVANVMFTYELARRLDGSGVTVNCLHPGLVASNFASNTAGWFGWVAKLMYLSPFAITPEQGAETSIFLASSPEVEKVTGKYFNKCKQAKSSAITYDTAACRQLWEASEKLLKTPALT